MSVIIMGKSINQSCYTLYDNINSFNKFCETFLLIHTTKTVICIAASVTAEIATTLTRPWSRPLFKTLHTLHFFKKKKCDTYTICFL